MHLFAFHQLLVCHDIELSAQIIWSQGIIKHHLQLAWIFAEKNHIIHFGRALKKEKRYYREAIADAPKLLHPLLLCIYSVHLLLYLSYILQYSKNKLIHIVLSTIHVYYLYIILYTK